MNPAPLDSVSLIVPAAAGGQPGAKKYSLGGNMLLITSATYPFRMQFDAGSPFACRAGYKFGPDEDGFNTLTFFNDQATPLAINFDRGALGVDYVGTDEVKNVATFSLGNIGTAGSVPLNAPLATTVNGLFTNLAAAIRVPGTYNGHKRKFITFTCPATNNFLLILDAAGNYFSQLDGDNTHSVALTLETDADFLILGSIGICPFCVGEIYYSN